MKTLLSPHSLEEEIKKSRFIVHALPVESPEDVFHHLDRLGDPKATHNCWAYKIDDQYRFSDDGEPAGTAGRPILSAIEGQGLDHVMVLVVRYFGGIKLGAGGLTRAYGGSAASCLHAAPKREIFPKVTLQLKAPFALIGQVYTAIERYEAGKLDEQYLSDGVMIRLEVLENRQVEFLDYLRDSCRNKVAVEPLT